MPVLTADDLRCPPRFATPRTPSRPTLGPGLAKVADKLGKPLHPHQRLIADVALEIDPDTGYLAYDEVVIIINRQQGKTEFMFPLMTHRCTGFTDALSNWVRRELGREVMPPGPQRVLYTAQTADNAKVKWRDVHVNRLEKSPFRTQFSTRLRTNFEQIEWTNGSTWAPGATTAKTGGTGDTLDLAVIDEAWAKEDMRTELSLRPAMLTRRWKQLWIASMIPGLARRLPGQWPYLHLKRQNGRARVQSGVRSRVCYMEWSAAEGMDPADPDTWWSCMPGLASGLVDESAIASDFEALGLVDFSAEYLGWEPEANAARWLVVSEQTWRSLAVPASTDYLEPIALGVHAAPDQSVASIGMSALDASGDTYVELVERQPGLTWAVPAIVDLAKRVGPCAIGIAAHGPAAPIIEPLRRALLDANVDTNVAGLTVMQGPALSRACRQFFLETGEVGVADQDNPDRRIRHINQPELNDSVAQAQKYVYGDEWRWQQEGADPLYAVTLARAAGEDVEWLGGSYAVADSLG
jgi:hypothetical protein